MGRNQRATERRQLRSTIMEMRMPKDKPSQVYCPRCSQPMSHVDGDDIRSDTDAANRARMIHLTGGESGFLCWPCREAVPE